MEKRALLSVWNKTGIVELGRELERLGYAILSTGGTFRVLEEAGVAVTAVSDVTGFPEILGGRVKTLHPAIHGGILARRKESHLNELAAQGIAPIDLVVVNLYPFGETARKPGVTWEEVIENIDIGGPTMVRAAAKNHESVTVVVNPSHYAELLAALEEAGETSPGFRRQLALEAFAHTAAYDATIARYFSRELHPEQLPETMLFYSDHKTALRYGENPHQKGAFYLDDQARGLNKARILQGKELSYNNLMDLDACLGMVMEFEEPVAVLVKHTNPCGAAIGETIGEAYRKAYQADPLSAFGSVMGFNRTIDGETARDITETFMEAVLAPGYTQEALEIFSAKKNVRVLEIPLEERLERREVRAIRGGFLLQDRDEALWDETPEPVTEKQPTAQQMRDLTFAWKLVKHVKSNAIVMVKDGVTTGVGPGQTNRVGAARIALEMAGDRAKGSVLASDAFFPFRDTVDLAAAHGITAVIQPGGSLRDTESLEACEEHGIAMVFTGMRHFRH